MSSYVSKSLVKITLVGTFPTKWEQEVLYQPSQIKAVQTVSKSNGGPDVGKCQVKLVGGSKDEWQTVKEDEDTILERIDRARGK